MSSADGHVHTIPKSNSYLTLKGQFVTDGQCTFHIFLSSLGKSWYSIYSCYSVFSSFAQTAVSSRHRRLLHITK
ncbi:hypothetical protein ABFA07_016475 [Porites harrisoni]